MQNNKVSSNLLGNFEREKLCIVTSDGKLYTYGDLHDIVYEFQLKYNYLHSSKIAVTAKDRHSSAIALLCVSSIASTVFVVPPSIDETCLNDFLLKANVNFLIKFDADFIDVINLDCDNPGLALVDTEQDWLLATSGTSGVPKLMSYSFSSLTGSTKKTLIPEKSFVWALVYDLNRFAGLQVFFQAIMSGSTIALTEASSSVSSMLDFFHHNKVNELSATPTFWRKLLMSKGISSLPLKLVTLGGEIADQKVLDALSAAFPSASIRHIYASTEAGVGFSVKDKIAGFPLCYLTASDNDIPAMKIVNDSLWVKPKFGAKKVLSGKVVFDEYGYLCTGDLVTVLNDRVYFLGRDSGAINVGGNKVIPEEIERILLECSLVSVSRVYGKKSSILGTLVAAEIVLNENNTDLVSCKKQILDFCRSRLDSYKIPALIKFVDDIKINDTGKIQRH